MSYQLGLLAIFECVSNEISANNGTALGQERDQANTEELQIIGLANTPIFTSQWILHNVNISMILL